MVTRALAVCVLAPCSALWLAAAHAPAYAPPSPPSPPSAPATPGAAVPPALPTPPAPPASSSFAAKFAHYAVAADHEAASRAGAEIVAAGGNAVDGAVAAGFALSVVRPMSCGIGGGGFMVVHLKEAVKGRGGRGGRGGPVDVALNFRETCPAAITPDFFEKGGAGEKRAAREKGGGQAGANVEPLPDDASTIGGLAVCVPGSVAGLLEALEQYGTMERAAVLAPAIRLAREGFVVDEAYMKGASSLIAKFNAKPEMQSRFAFVWERYLLKGAVKVGDRIVIAEQAEALELIAKQGAKAFYEGEIAKAMVEATKSAGGVVTLADLRAFTVERGPALVYTFRGDTFLGMPLPSSGGLAMAQTLGILERRKIDDLAARGKAAGEDLPTEVAWAVTEAFKHAFSDRARFAGDLRGRAASDLVAKVLNPGYLDALAASCRPGRTAGPAAYGSGWTTNDAGEVIPDDGGTSHVSVVDGQGNAAALTQTINLELGSLVGVPKYGFVLNNEMDDFTTRADRGNAFGLRQSDRNRPGHEGGRGHRPLSSMSPTIVLDAHGNVKAVAGASGGPRIITGTTLVLLNTLVMGMPADRAVSAARFHHQWLPDEVQIDERLKEQTSQGLDLETWFKKGHYRPVPMKSESAVQVIVREGEGEKGVWHAASDPRKGGKPAGG